MSEAYSKMTVQTMQEGIPRRYTMVFVNQEYSGDYHMVDLEDRLTEITTEEDGDPFMVVMPPVTQAAGMMFVIRLVELGDDEVVIIFSRGDDPTFFLGLLSTEKDYVMLYSDGRHWIDMGCGCGIAFKEP
jgi:hypothetical protein